MPAPTQQELDEFWAQASQYQECLFYNELHTEPQTPEQKHVWPEQAPNVVNPYRNMPHKDYVHNNALKYQPDYYALVIKLLVFVGSAAFTTAFIIWLRFELIKFMAR